ncbi:MAG: phosphoadenosine phosphosulfate reductase [Chloroflexota bacterium]|jgi:phosphoadenosine phosphosulfate reductase|nr:phosphoadenosine phosphosulfate reductase [Chloroflexota bacterium]
MTAAPILLRPVAASFLPVELVRTPIPVHTEHLDALQVLRLALDVIGSERIALSASFGPEDIVLLDLLTELVPRPRVFTLDTGRLPQETYDLIDAVRHRFGVEVEVVFPDAREVEAMTRERGVNLFYRSIDDRRRCCDVRKVAPLRRALQGLDGWITGVRRDQIGTRSGTLKIGFDLEHGMIWKVAPLADWTEEEVWARIRQRDLPYNALHDAGYPSIGCAPCSRAVPAGADARSGRWWWEQPDERECGIHVPGVPAASVVPATGNAA